MKKIIFSITLALACWSNMMMAEIHEHEYVPLLEDGRQWIYSFIDGTWNAESEDYITSSGFYKFYLQGDTVIDGKNYLKCYYKPILGHYISFDEDIPIAYVREESKKVYSISERYGLADDILYDFEDMNNAFFAYGYDQLFDDVNDIILASKWRRVFKVDNTVIIEGIGTDGHGDLLFPVLPYTTCERCDNYPLNDGLAMMLDKEGNILYKGSTYVKYLESKVAGDVNGDGKVNVSDVTALINLILGIK